MQYLEFWTARSDFQGPPVGARHWVPVNYSKVAGLSGSRLAPGVPRQFLPPYRVPVMRSRPTGQTFWTPLTNHHASHRQERLRTLAAGRWFFTSHQSRAQILEIQIIEWRGWRFLWL